MKTRPMREYLAAALLLSTISYQLSTHAQGSAFTYQGRLDDGLYPVNGLFDFQFRVFDTALTNTGTSLGSPNPNALNAVSVTNGFFTVILDFGNAPFSTGAPRWLEIGVRTNGTGSFSTLNLRQALTAAPYAITAGNITGVVPSAGLTGSYSASLTFNNPSNSFTGNGGGLTNVNALTLGGIGADGFWRTTGNGGTTPGPNFLGTTDNQPLEIQVNGTRALRIEPTGAAPTLMGGYYQNYASGPGAVVAGGGASGSINEAAVMYAFVGAGHGSKAGPLSAVVGGAYNVSLSQFSFIGTGLANTNSGPGSVIVGGTNNSVVPLADNAFIGGGNNNLVSNTHGTIGGGDQNVASSWSTVGGGEANQSSSSFCTVAGGRFNQSAGIYASVGGGYNNLSSGDHATVGGGFSNTSGSTDATVGGGSDNLIQANSASSVISGGQVNLIRANSAFATIGGGSQNEIHESAGWSAIGGGWMNKIRVTADQSAIAGGNANEIYPGARESFIGGGFANLIHTNANNSVVGGGALNSVSNAVVATIGGGMSNSIQAASDASFIGGGQINLIQANSIFATIAGGQHNTIGNDAGAATIAGGFVNTIEPGAGSSFIAGGNGNRIQSGAVYSAIGGGLGNICSGADATVSGGNANTNSGDYATLGGGGGNNSSGYASTVGGGTLNSASGDWATVGGGGSNKGSGYASTVVGGGLNLASGLHATVGGGTYNTSSGMDATVAGGRLNLASGDYATVAGGIANAATNTASIVAGGASNQAIGQNSFVGGGSANVAGGLNSFAAGYRAQANQRGTFVWADSQDADFVSTAADQFNIRAAGGVRLNTDTSMFFGNQTRQTLNLWGTQYGIGVQAGTEYFRSSSDFSWFKGGLHDDASHAPGIGGTEMMRLDASGDLNVRGNVTANSLILTSDRNAKERFAPVDGRAVLDKVASLTLCEWNFKTDSRTRHIGPMAQDFHAAFQVGEDDRHIAVVDEGGVALAAIQGLNQKLAEELARRDAENAELKQELGEMQELLHSLAVKLNGGIP